MMTLINQAKTVYNTFLNGLLPLFHSDLTYPHHHLSFGIHLVWPFSFLLVPISNYSKSTLQQIFRYDLLPEVTSNCQKMLVSLFQYSIPSSYIYAIMQSVLQNSFFPSCQISHQSLFRQQHHTNTQKFLVFLVSWYSSN